MSFGYNTPAITKWRLDDFMKVINSFENAFAETVNHKMQIDHNYENILLYIVGKSLVTARGILTLCAHGYSDGALSLGRNLYEQMIIVLFFEMHKNDVDFQTYVDDFFLSYDVQRNKCLRDIGKYVPEKNNVALITDRESLKQHANREIKGDYWWTGYNTFSKLVDHVMISQTDNDFRKFFGIHYMRYKRACISLHAGCMGNSVRIGSNANFNVVDTSPSLYGQSTPLIYLTISLICIVRVVCTTFQIDYTEYLKALNELAVFYQKQESEDIHHNT